MIVTDLDHTMLGRGLRPGRVPKVLRLLDILGVSVIPNTAKTLEEVHLVWTKILSRPPPIFLAFENASALASPLDLLPYYDYKVEIEGITYRILELSPPLEAFADDALELAKTACGSLVRIEEMSPSLLSTVAGIPEEHVRAAVKRRYDLVLWATERSCLERAEALLAKAGYTTALGANFLHVMAHRGKEQLVDWIRDNRHLYDSWTRIVALGDAPVDQGMLEKADIAVVIPRNGRVKVRPRRDYIVAPLEAPDGWASVIEVLTLNNILLK